MRLHIAADILAEGWDCCSDVSVARCSNQRPVIWRSWAAG